MEVKMKYNDKRRYQMFKCRNFIISLKKKYLVILNLMVAACVNKAGRPTEKQLEEHFATK